MLETQKPRNNRKLLAQITKNDESGCWEWRGQVSNSGYGRVMLADNDGTKMFSAHRASYEIYIGPLDTDTIITQTCGNRLCINPEHLSKAE